MTDIESRLAALEAKGWRLVHEVPGRTIDLGDGLTQQIAGSYRFEKPLPGGGLINESGPTLEKAVEAASWQEKRLAALDSKPTAVEDGLISN